MIREVEIPLIVAFLLNSCTTAASLEDECDFLDVRLLLIKWVLFALAFDDYFRRAWKNLYRAGNFLELPLQ